MFVNMKTRITANPVYKDHKREKEIYIGQNVGQNVVKLVVWNPTVKHVTLYTEVVAMAT